MNKQAFVYILASQRNGTLYTGVTSNLVQRIYEHKTKAHAESFTAKYDVDKLVWYATGEDINAAIALEKKIKNRSRAWKLALIEKNNPNWLDLSMEFLDSASCNFVQDDARNDDAGSNAAPPPCHAARSRSIQKLRNDTAIMDSASCNFVQDDARNDDAGSNAAPPLCHAARSRSIQKLRNDTAIMDSATYARNDDAGVTA